MPGRFNRPHPLVRFALLVALATWAGLVAPRTADASQCERHAPTELDYGRPGEPLAEFAYRVAPPPRTLLFKPRCGVPDGLPTAPVAPPSSPAPAILEDHADSPRPTAAHRAEEAGFPDRSDPGIRRLDRPPRLV